MLQPQTAGTWTLPASLCTSYHALNKTQKSSRLRVCKADLHTICTECLSEPKEVCSCRGRKIPQAKIHCAGLTQRRWPSTLSHLSAQGREQGLGCRDWSGFRVKPSLNPSTEALGPPTQPPSAKSRCSISLWLECHFGVGTRCPLPSSESLGEVQGEPRRTQLPKGGRERGRVAGRRNSGGCGQRDVERRAGGAGSLPQPPPEVTGGEQRALGQRPGLFELPHDLRGLRRELGRERPAPSHL